MESFCIFLENKVDKTHCHLLNNASSRSIYTANQRHDLYQRHLCKDVMKVDGTINRAALPAIFNPEDLLGLEMALKAKDQLKNAEVTVITMGPSRAADIIREAIFRGADDGFVINNRKFAGSAL